MNSVVKQWPYEIPAGDRLLLGARLLSGNRCRFLVWAPLASEAQVRLLDPVEKIVPMEPVGQGYYETVVENIAPGCRYFFRLRPLPPKEQGSLLERPDPASRSQPDGVHGPSQVTSADFNWEDRQWRGTTLDRLVIYELHIGTFTPEGTFDAAIAHLDALENLGITAVEIMPVAQFPGKRNWGYDGVLPFAVQNSYGGQAGFKRFVNACHQRGLAVVLDVVYNHLGPEGNYLHDYGYYFSSAYRPIWGEALNYDGPYSDHVRRFFIENALYWFDECHVDALRLDAIHAIMDFSAYPFLRELSDRVRGLSRELNRSLLLIAESDLNDTRVLRPSSSNGLGMDAQWFDDFHHALHAYLTDEKSGYYEDFGRLTHLELALTEGFVHGGRYSRYRKRRYGNSSRDVSAERFVVFAQNHDQIGNRLLGERLGALVTFDQLKMAAALVLLSPYVPLLFMGEEYADPAPFPYFISHTDPELVKAVREGRAREFAAFGWTREPPDPQSEEVFATAILSHRLREQQPHKGLLDYYRDLIALRKSVGALRLLSRKHMQVTTDEDKRILQVRRWCEVDEAVLVLHFGDSSESCSLEWNRGVWRKRMDSAEKPGAVNSRALPSEMVSPGNVELKMQPWSAALFVREKDTTERLQDDN